MRQTSRQRAWVMPCGVRRSTRARREWRLRSLGGTRGRPGERTDDLVADDGRDLADAKESVTLPAVGEQPDLRGCGDVAVRRRWRRIDPAVEPRCGRAAVDPVEANRLTRLQEILLAVLEHVEEGVPHFTRHPQDVRVIALR